MKRPSPPPARPRSGGVPAAARPEPPPPAVEPSHPPRPTGRGAQTSPAVPAGSPSRAESPASPAPGVRPVPGLRRPAAAPWPRARGERPASLAEPLGWGAPLPPGPRARHGLPSGGLGAAPRRLRREGKAVSAWPGPARGCTDLLDRAQVPEQRPRIPRAGGGCEEAAPPPGGPFTGNIPESKRFSALNL